jgi:hypothetical protein
LTERCSGSNRHGRPGATSVLKLTVSVRSETVRVEGVARSAALGDRGVVLGCGERVIVVDLEQAQSRS